MYHNKMKDEWKMYIFNSMKLALVVKMNIEKKIGTKKRWAITLS